MEIKGINSNYTTNKKEEKQHKKKLHEALANLRVNPQQTKANKEAINAKPTPKLPPALANLRVNPEETRARKEAQKNAQPKTLSPELASFKVDQNKRKKLH